MELETAKSENRADEPATAEQLAYYFDSQTKDRLDRGVLSARADLMLRIRDRILKLPEEQCLIALKTIDKLVASLSDDQAENTTGPDRKTARELFDRTALASATGPSVDQIGKI
jgi:hypothetical protein